MELFTKNEEKSAVCGEPNDDTFGDLSWNDCLNIGSSIEKISVLLFFGFVCCIENVDAAYSTNDNGYYIGVSRDSTISWNDAKLYCETQIGSTLASIHSDTQNGNAISSVAGTSFAPSSSIIRYAWIGYNDVNNDGIFEWSDGTSNTDYTNWDTATGQPNSPDQDCAQLSGLNTPGWNGRWNDDDCSGEEFGGVFAFVCNRPQAQLFSSYEESFYIGVSSNKEISWTDALSYCESTYGTKLASIHSSSDNVIARHAVGGTTFAPSDSKQRYAWIGYNDLNKDGTFEWSDGSINTDYRNWYPGEPSNMANTEYCAFLSGSNWDIERRWYGDSDCDNSESGVYAFVCNKPGRALFSNKYNGDYIGVSSNIPVSWNDANFYCERTFGSTLASIHSDTQNGNAISSVAGTTFEPSNNIIRYAWIGYNDVNNDGIFEWSDGTSNNDYTNWDTATGQPNSQNQDCAQLSGPNEPNWQGRWNDDECYRLETFAFVCNKAPKYIGSDFPTTWSNANNYCQITYDSTLASIHSDDDRSRAINAVLQSSNGATDRFFIGLKDDDGNGVWEWIDNSATNYFASNFGISGDGDCVEDIFNSAEYGWNDLSCDHLRYFACNNNHYNL